MAEVRVACRGGQVGGGEGGNRRRWRHGEGRRQRRAKSGSFSCSSAASKEVEAGDGTLSIGFVRGVWRFVQPAVVSIGSLGEVGEEGKRGA